MAERKVHHATGRRSYDLPLTRRLDNYQLIR